MKKKLMRTVAAVLAGITLLLSLGLTASADTSAEYVVFTGSQKLEGWYPSFITQYKDPAKMDGFIEAIQHENAVIEIVYSGTAAPSLLLQSYPVKDGSQKYPHANYDTYKSSTKGSDKVATFEAKGLIEKYTSTKHPDDNSNLRLDNVLNFGIGGEGNAVKSVKVKWTFKGSPAINVSLDSTHQEMVGFGASYTWYGDWILMTNKKETIFDWIFKDCKFNILRFRDLQLVRAYGGVWEDTKYPAYKAYYDAAVKRGIDPIVVVTSWGQYNEADWCTLSKDADGNEFYTLKKDKNGKYRYDDLAKFCVKSVQLFIDAGIPVDYFSISNEVELQQYRVDEKGNAKSDAGFFLGTEETKYYCSYAKAYIAVYEAFKKAFGDNAPKLLAAETMAANPELLKKYIDPIIKECPESVTDVAHHLYGSSLTSANFAKISEQYSDKYTLWQTEWYNNDFLDHASVMVNELESENLNAYLYWVGLWIPDDANCLIQMDKYAADSPVSRRGNHYIMEHFSRFILPGYIRVDCDEYACSTKSVAFKSPDGKKLVIVAVNNTQSDEKLKFNIGAKVKKATIYRSTVTTKDPAKERTENRYMKNLLLTGGFKDGYKFTVKKGTINTIVIELE